MDSSTKDESEAVAALVHVAAEVPDRASAELAMLGLSPDFPERLADLNSALAESMGNSDANFAGYTFTLSPDSTRPAIEAKQNFSFPFTVELNVSPAKKARLELTPKYGRSQLTSVSLDQLQTILGDFEREFSVTVFEPLSSDEAFSKPLDDLTEEEAKNIHPASLIAIVASVEVVGDHPTTFQIQASKQFNRSQTGEVIPTFLIKGVVVEGPSAVVDGSLPIVADLAKAWHARP